MDQSGKAIPVLKRARLVGPRVVLTGQTSADAVDCFPLVFERPAIMDMLAWNGPEDLSSLKTFFAEWRQGGGTHGHDYFFVIRLEDGRACGHCGLRFGAWERASGAPRIGDIGYWMGEAFWGQGLMTEAVRLLVWLAFEQLDADGVSGRCLEHNIGSRRVLEKAGLNHDPDFVPGVSAHGADACERGYRLLRAERIASVAPIEHELVFED
jgi:RimJ/RimL family protein N-acetyltransferase